jgi:hypothetical protein
MSDRFTAHDFSDRESMLNWLNQELPAEAEIVSIHEHEHEFYYSVILDHQGIGTWPIWSSLMKFLRWQKADV